MSQPLSIRLPDATLARLRSRAHLVHLPPRTLVQRYVEESLRMDEHPLIHFRDGAAGRRPALVGSRLDVADVIETLRQNDNSVELTADYLNVPVNRIEACLRYYADYGPEIDDWIERGREIAEREEERWRRRGEALA